MLGYDSTTPVIGRPALEFVAPEDRALVAENLRQRLAGEAQSLCYHFRGIRRDGSHVRWGRTDRSASMPASGS